MLIFLSFLTLLSTFAGGMVGLKFKNHLHSILGFTAGVLLAVVAFDLLPQIHELSLSTGVNIRQAMIALVLGFLVFHIIEKWLLIHHAHEHEYGEHKHPTVGIASALALIGHSFLDGVGIGLAFQVSSAVGLIVAIAVIAHDFSDGLNTVSLMLANKNTDRLAKMFLVFDAVAPVLGALSTLLFTLSDTKLLWYLGFFAGFLLYIGASDILPEAHSKHSSVKTIALTIAGVVFIFIVTRFA